MKVVHLGLYELFNDPSNKRNPSVSMNMINYFLFICFLEAVHCYVNVALNKTAYQQNPLKQNYSTGDASNAVDGQKSDLTRNGGQCVVSAGRETATWWVNLTSIHSIHNITIYYMTDNKPWGASNDFTKSFLGFSVYVSNTTDKETGTLCFKDSNFTTDTIPTVFSTICPVHGQYVIYYNERSIDVTYPDYYYRFAENNVCEVEVYGCPLNGWYGSNNSFPCPDVNCQYCHKETGTCQVCQPGYKGQKCELECETGRYGINCSRSCGNCLKLSQCQNIDGSCSEGCSVGYKGSLCTEQCETRKYGINCSKNCGNCYKQYQCHHVDGFCSEGCSAGYKGSLCNELANLGNVIEENSKNEEDGFKKNYSTLLYGERYPCEIEKLLENVTKNRFKTTFPYDHSRVKLVNKESDYINANYIDGICKENCYIATQGPTQYTVGDFWLMVWQEHVEQIVMLTNLMEGPKRKCFQYWPDLEETMACDMFSLHTITERHYACYSIRILSLTKNMEQNKSRTITQYHYTAWPDHGTPDPLCLFMFHNHVTRTKLSNLKVPVLVHCSAGIGRTGTYIAIDALYEEGQQKSKINIAKYVRKMREKRMNMVQTYVNKIYNRCIYHLK